VKHLQQLLDIWKRVLALLGEACPRLSLAVAVVTLLEAVTGIGVLYVVKLLVDAISRNIGSLQSDGLEPVLPYLVLTGAALVAMVLIQNVGSMLRLRQSQAVSEYVDQLIHDRAILVDLQFYESPLYYDSLAQARNGGPQRPAQIVGNVILTFKAVIVLSAVLVLLAAMNPLLIPLLLVPVLIALFVRLYYTRKLFDWRMARAQLERRASYLDWMMTSANQAKELRLNRIGQLFRDQHRALKVKINRGQMTIEQSRLLTEFAVAVLGAAVFIVACAWLLQQTLTQQRPIGDVVLFVLLLRRAEGGGSELVGNVSKIVDDHLYLRRLFEFLSIKPKIAAPPSPKSLPAELNEGVKLSGVSFKYDGAPDYALQDVSLQIRPGQIVALVGENGSGKTTLIKLLTRLYDPAGGSITLDGVDIRGFDPEKYRELFSVIFQDFATYAETAADNIRFGDVHLPHDPATIREAAERAGAAGFIERLPKSYDTPLTKIFDNGQDLSIGQWQRLALARSFYPRSKFIILDEPTSAVDPKAEFELFDGFRDRIDNRGALIISHRLSTVRQADYTYVLHEGRIVEHGAHADLMAAKGVYAELFDKQAQYYR
jgi:ATP-binding cassette, subfamily B, bacterial